VAAVATVGTSAPLIMSGVYGSDINSPMKELGYVNGNAIPLMSSGGAQNWGVLVFFSGVDIRC
jgi:hypothetical protein